MNCRLRWYFFKQLNFWNLLISLSISIIVFSIQFSIDIPFKQWNFEVMPIFYITGGYLLSIFFYELTRQKQKYYFYNMGLTNFDLYISSTLLTIIFGGTLFTLIRIWKIS